MTDEGDGVRPRGSAGGAPIDADRLDVIAERFRGDERFSRVEDHSGVASDRLLCVYDAGFYPDHVQQARLEIVWFENGDFSLHYHEKHEGDTFDHRWDRHPSDHNTRDHVHPGPDAPTPGDDASHPQEWRDVLSMVLTAVETRQRHFWTQ